MPDVGLIARLYQETRERIIDLVSDLDAWGVPVPACPGWSVRDVAAHLAGVAQDWVGGTSTGPPTDAQTAAQIARFAGCSAAEILATWTETAARVEQVAERTGLTAPLGDVTSHEHDIRAALGQPGGRDSAAVWYSCDGVLRNFVTPVPLVVTVEDAAYRSGPPGGAEIRLSTTRFEALRWRTGRRSRVQLAAMNWSGDPADVLDHLCLFGPAGADLLE